MKRALTTALAAALSLTAASALAADLVFPGGTDLTESLKGQTYWSTQAQCAGLFGATSNYLSEQGDQAGAEAAKAQAVGFANDAIARLMTDRGVSRADAVALVQPAVLSGRSAGLKSLADGGLGSKSGWNFARSACLDVADIYKASAR